MEKIDLKVSQLAKDVSWTQLQTINFQYLGNPLQILETQNHELQEQLFPVTFSGIYVLFVPAWDYISYVSMKSKNGSGRKDKLQVCGYPHWGILNQEISSLLCFWPQKSQGQRASGGLSLIESEVGHDWIDCACNGLTMEGLYIDGRTNIERQEKQG